jgi:hypothetical protein
MFNSKLITVGSFSDINTCKRIFPDAEFSDVLNLISKCTIKDVEDCRECFPYADIPAVKSILASREFIRWYKKTAKTAAVIAPVFMLTLFNILPGSIAFDWLLRPSVAYSADAEAVATMAAADTGFFAGKGVILIHMLVVGFFTLVVSSFLKFTGRGDLIPLVMFVGGGAILYEVIGLFSSLYGSIRALLNM